MYWLFDSVAMALTILVFIVGAIFAVWLLFATPFGLLLFLAVGVIGILRWVTTPKKEF